MTIQPDWIAISATRVLKRNKNVPKFSSGERGCYSPHRRNPPVFHLYYQVGGIARFNPRLLPPSCGRCRRTTNGSLSPTGGEGPGEGAIRAESDGVRSPPNRHPQVCPGGTFRFSRAVEYRHHVPGEPAQLLDELAGRQAFGPVDHEV